MLVFVEDPVLAVISADAETAIRVGSVTGGGNERSAGCSPLPGGSVGAAEPFVLTTCVEQVSLIISNVYVQ